MGPITELTCITTGVTLLIKKAAARQSTKLITYKYLYGKADKINCFILKASYTGSF
jgi:hypothetical protein